MNLEELRDRYVAFQMDGHPDLTEFLDRVVAGDFGPVSPELLAEFLDSVEADIVGNMETMAAANPDLAARKDEALAAQLEWLRRIREKYVARR
ncbi:hypothetical protein [Caldinitratiruptor microaerophilus]|uniref:Uncharacterized protein n=1 Tax=Caldinitratiruptor microaerophilus TaxID=671077 RepID=A0AA35CHS7_9FIRM|nr:hypothetical protein [Caldinitratiruptor microaerophilus]BDG59249.1 hypothetical protein caldi_03390 [Caldinitratiruptor microaerophilus]